MRNPHGCFIVQMLMNNLPADQRTKLAHILLDVEDPDAAQKLIQELIVDVNGSRSLEGLVRSASDEVVNSLFISWERGGTERFLHAHRTILLDKLVEYCEGLRSNFVVQMFFSRVTDPSLVGSGLGFHAGGASVRSSRRSPRDSLQ